MASLGKIGFDPEQFQDFLGTMRDLTAELKRFNDAHEQEIITVDLGDQGEYVGPRHAFPGAFKTALTGRRQIVVNTYNQSG